MDLLILCPGSGGIIKEADVKKWRGKYGWIKAENEVGYYFEDVIDIWGGVKRGIFYENDGDDAFLSLNVKGLAFIPEQYHFIYLRPRIVFFDDTGEIAKWSSPLYSELRLPKFVPYAQIKGRDLYVKKWGKEGILR